MEDDSDLDLQPTVAGKRLFDEDDTYIRPGKTLANSISERLHGLVCLANLNHLL
jgi:hypothetical protein